MCAIRCKDKVIEKLVEWERDAQELPRFEPVKSDPANDPPPKPEPEKPVQHAPAPDPNDKYPFRD